MLLRSPAIQTDQPIPRRFACDGENLSPAFFWEDAPKETKSFVLIIHDPDAPRKDGFTHWLLYDIPPNITNLREGFPKQAIWECRARMTQATWVIQARVRRREHIGTSRDSTRCGTKSVCRPARQPPK